MSNTTDYNQIKEKLTTILQSEKSINFLNNLTNLTLSLGNAPQNTNAFIDNVFMDYDISKINKNARKRYVNDITINNKKILIRTASVSSSFNIIKFKKIKNENEDEDSNNIKNKINKELNNFDYLLFIRVEDEYDEELKSLKVCYHYYLFPFDNFKLKENLQVYNNKKSLCSYQWFYDSRNDLYFKYNIKSLILYEICPPYVSL